MDLPKVLPAIKTQIGEGNIEPALVQLVALLDSDPQYSELAQIARMNQRELYQIKSQSIRGTISSEAAQLAINQITDNILQIIHRLESGKLTFSDPTLAPNRSQAWRYYVMGGVVTLLAGFLIWRFLYYQPNQDSCPQFDSKTRFKVMILPFKQTGEKKSINPAVDIADGLNVLFSRTVNLQNDAVADVNEQYDIDSNYPSLTEATTIAQDCGVQMIVWGKINETTSEGYKLDVRYKLLNGAIASTGDTTLSNVLKMNDFGNLTRDVDAATRLLYIVLANWANVPIASNLLETTSKIAAMDTSAMELPDTTALLAIARSHLIKNESDQAEAIYGQILEVYPAQPTARRMRGGLLYQKGDFAGAAADLDIAAPDANTADQSILKIRAESAVKSGQPAKADQDLKVLRWKIPNEKVWLNTWEQALAVTTEAIEKQLVSQEQKVAEKPQDPKLHNQAARSNLALGQPDKALKHARTAIKNDPKNRAGYEMAVEASLQKGDTITARQVLEAALRNGVTVGDVKKWFLQVPPLQKPNPRQDQ